MIIIGIDPGITGAVAKIRTTMGTFLVKDTPMTVIKKGKKTHREYLPTEMARLLRGLKPENTHVFIEQVGAMPKQGVSSVFGFEKGYGIWIGIVAALGLPVTFVTPQKWKKIMMEGIADKDAARLRAQQMFPCLADELNLKKHDGRAEALLIAEYGRRLLLKK